MYGLPTDLDLGFFVGSTLHQVCIGANELILHFDHGVSLTIESEFLVGDPARGSEKFDRPRPSAARIVGLIDRTVRRADGTADGTLVLVFDQDYRLEVHDSSSQYESYQIHHDSRIIVV